MMRSKKLFKNFISSFILQLTTIFYGFIVPKILILNFGSELYGLTVSITQFLGYIALLEGGIGAVTRTALYKPLANNDFDSVNQIIKSSRIFFRKISYVLIGYAMLLAALFPSFNTINRSAFFISTLVGIIAIGSFIQYYFGITNQILLHADQKLYLNDTLRVISLLLNLIITLLLVRFSFGIHIIKISTATLFSIRPLLLYLYVKKKYAIDPLSAYPKNEYLSQRWHGITQHIAYFILNNTDIVILTFFSSLKEVAVYAIYYMIIKTIKNVTMIFANGIDAFFGNMIAKDEHTQLASNFMVIEFIIYSATTILFTTTAITLIPFIEIYASAFSDADYIRPIFAYILIASQAFACLRTPYLQLVFASGHYKQTSISSVVEFMINIFFSLVLVIKLGLIGVAIGTLSAMFYRVIQLGKYTSKNLLKRNYNKFIKRILIFLLTAGIIILLNSLLVVHPIISYMQWFLYAFKTFFINTIITFIISILFYRNNTIQTIHIFSKMIKTL